MKFRTEYVAHKAPFTLNPQNPVVLAGSCFSQNIAAKMQSHLWQAENPLGTLYNPLSICQAIYMMLDEEKGPDNYEKSLFFYNGVWNSKKFDSSFSSATKQDCIQDFINRRDIFIDTLRRGKTLIVTFGTSIVYYDHEEQLPYGNCHKLPADRFFTSRLTSSEIMSFWSEVIEKLQEMFPDIRIIFTVSPVRHIKDGFVGNARSKAVLLLAIEEICRFNENCYYFPAYEILNDDLRDYRFYATDLVHPSEEGIQYIWEKFCETFLEEEGKRILNEGAKKIKAMAHRPKIGALSRPLNP